MSPPGGTGPPSHRPSERGRPQGQESPRIRSAHRRASHDVPGERWFLRNPGKLKHVRRLLHAAIWTHGLAPEALGGVLGIIRQHCAELDVTLGRMPATGRFLALLLELGDGCREDGEALWRPLIRALGKRRRVGQPARPSCKLCKSLPLLLICTKIRGCLYLPWRDFCAELWGGKLI